jgi:hypothetical protein
MYTHPILFTLIALVMIAAMWIGNIVTLVVIAQAMMWVAERIRDWWVKRP